VNARFKTFLKGVFLMMDTGQRVKLVKSRAWQIRRRQEKHITERLSLVSVVLCCCLIYAMGHFPDRSPGAVQGLNGATMLLENVGSYVLVGVICFIAAVVVTVFCTRLRKKNNKQEEQTKEDEET
jgi:choline-glycine betaine transporter